MKLIVVFALLGVVCASPPSDFRLSSLPDDLRDFLKLIPVDKCKAIVADHLQKDGGFNKVIIYLQGPEWTKLVTEVRALPPVQKFAKYMVDAGFDVVGLLAKIHHDIASLKPGMQPGNNPSLKEFIADIEKLIPTEKLLALLDEKMKNSDEFRDFFAKISSDQAKELVEDARKIPEVLRVNEELSKMGVNVEEIWQLVYKFLGWGKSIL